MATAKEVITDALEDILEQSAEEPVASSDGEAARRYLNDMMFMWEAKGIRLGYTEVNSLGDTVKVPRGSLSGIKANLSVFLAPKFGAEVSASLLQRARAGWKTILSIAQQPIPKEYPDILPKGSGNSYPRANTSTFYTQTSYEAATTARMSNTDTTVTISAAKTPTVIGEGWTEVTSQQFTLTAAGKMTYNGVKENLVFTAELDLDISTGTDEICAYFTKNGVEVPETRITKNVISGSSVMFNLVYVDQIVTDDYIEIYAENNDTSANITVDTAQVEVN